MIWQESAACVQCPELPWTTDAHHLPDSTVITMRAVCAACPVLAECDAATKDLRITGGFWAGADRNISRTAGQLVLDIPV